MRDETHSSVTSDGSMRIESIENKGFPNVRRRPDAVA
jgi:hypothetical protein